MAQVAQRPASDWLDERPFVPLLTEANGCWHNKQFNQQPPDELDTALTDLARWYVHVHAENSNRWPLGTECQGSSATTLASKLVGHGMWASSYRNGSYTSQAPDENSINFQEAGDIEASAPLGILTFWPGDAVPHRSGNPDAPHARLASPITASETELSVTSAAPVAPADAPATWPFLASRGAGTGVEAHSKNTHDVVSWVRIGAELMQVIEPPVITDGVVSLTVRRGLWGTSPQPHEARARVLAPVYVGSSAAVADDVPLAGSPAVDDPARPLRYALKVWRGDVTAWLANRITHTFGAGLGGHDTVWLDVSTCNLYNQADARGLPVAGWDDPVASKMTRVRWADHQRTKIAGLRSRLGEVRLTGNNFGGSFDSCTMGLATDGTFDAVVLERWMQTTGGWDTDWAAAMRQHLRLQSARVPSIYWVRWQLAPDPERYLRFAYGSLLLGWEPGIHTQFGGPFGLSRPDDLLFFDLGVPDPSAAALEDLADPGVPGLYRRSFSDGLVLVNPTSEPLTARLDGEWWNVSRTSDPKSPVSGTVTVPANDARILLGPVELGDGGSSDVPKEPGPSRTEPGGTSPTTACDIDEVARLAGPDRFGTAAAVGQHAFPDRTTTVVIARGDDYADALAAAPLAATLTAPILLSNHDRLPEATQAEIARLGPSSAVVIGGSAALSPSIESELESLGVTRVDRIAGSSRFDTAARIAARVGGDRAYVVEGSSPDPLRGWPDAVAVSWLAARQGIPILLVTSGAIPDATERTLRSMSSAVIVGGKVSVSEQVAADVSAAMGPESAPIRRLGGADRYATSVDVLESAASSGIAPGAIWVASGRAWPDALTGAPAAAHMGAAMLLVDGTDLSRSEASAAWLESSPDDACITVMGGPVAISDAVATQLTARMP